MRRRRLSLLPAIAITLGSCVTPLSSGNPPDLPPKPLPSADTMPQDPVQRAVWFIHFITALADNGGVHDQTELSSIFTGSTKIVPSTPSVYNFTCPSTGKPSSARHDGARLDNTWFHAMPGGFAHMSYPGFTINPPGETGAPVLDYTADLSQCLETPYNRVSWEISFDNLPAFACITGTALMAAAPAFTEERITDGGIGFSYAGKIEQETSTSAEFTGWFGGPCLISATVSRTGGQGYRLMRAQYKWNTCLRRSGAAFCKMHPDFRFSYPPDRSMLSLMDAKEQHVLAKCGGFNDYYAKETASGPIPPPPPASGYFWQSRTFERVCPQQ